METPDPWKLAERLGVTIHYVNLSNARGYTHGPHDVYLCKSLNWVEARCTLFHEVVHVAFGHIGHQEPRVELHVRYTVARDLVPWHNLLHVARHGPAAEIARDLDVTPAVLRDRMDCASPAELKELRSVYFGYVGTERQESDTALRQGQEVARRLHRRSGTA